MFHINILLMHTFYYYSFPYKTMDLRSIFKEQCTHQTWEKKLLR